MARAALGWRYRVDVAGRLAAAMAGGYGIAALVAIAGAWTLPMAPFEAATVGTIVALVAMPVATMGCFCAKSATRAWVGTLLVGAVLAGTAMLGGWRP